MDKKTVMILGEHEDRFVETYFPNELVSMLLARGVTAWVMPKYLKVPSHEN